MAIPIMDDNVAGVLLTGTTATTADAQHRLGTVVKGTNGSKFMYVRAASAVAVNDVCSLLVDNTVAPLTLQNASLHGNSVAFAQTSIASASFGWVALEGNNLIIKVLADCVQSKPLFATTTGGALDDATGASGVGFLAGVVTLASVSNATATTAICRNAHIGWYGNVA